MNRLRKNLIVRIVLVLALALVVYLGLNLRTRYFLNNQLEIGVVAVLDDMEHRIRIKHQADKNIQTD